MKIAAEEFAARREAFAAALEGRGLAGAVLFDAHRVSYYTGFAFIPTERPIAFALATDGRGGMLVPRLEVEHAWANAAVEEVAHYDEYPGERHPMDALRELLDALGVRGRLGADQDGYPWVFGYRGPGLGEFTLVTDLVEDQMAIKSEAEIALLRESSKWANLAHTLLQRYTRPGLRETEVSARAGIEATRRCSTRSGRSTAARASGSRERSPATAARSGAERQSRTPSPGTSSSRPATCS
jgi:Xaa-Pro dipeptidase